MEYSFVSLTNIAVAIITTILILPYIYKIVKPILSNKESSLAITFALGAMFAYALYKTPTYEQYLLLGTVAILWIFSKLTNSTITFLTNSLLALVSLYVLPNKILIYAFIGTLLAHTFLYGRVFSKKEIILKERSKINTLLIVIFEIFVVGAIFMILQYIISAYTYQSYVLPLNNIHPFIIQALLVGAGVVLTNTILRESLTFLIAYISQSRINTLSQTIAQEIKELEMQKQMIRQNKIKILNDPNLNENTKLDLAQSYDKEIKKIELKIQKLKDQMKNSLE